MRMALLKCMEKLQNTDILDNSINLILLPKNSSVTRLITEDIYRLLLDSGPSHTLEG